MDVEVRPSRLIAAWILALAVTLLWGTAFMLLADTLPNGPARAVIWNGGFASAILLGPLLIHSLYGRRPGSITPVYIASLLFNVVASFGCLVWVAFNLAWRRGNLEL